MTPQAPLNTEPADTKAKSVKKSVSSHKVTDKQMRLILIGVILLLGLVFLLLAIKGSHALSSKSQKLIEVKLKSKTVDAQLASLEIAKKQVEKYSYFNNVAKTVLPTDKDQAQAVLDIFQLASQSGIAIATITFPASTLGGTAASTPATGSTTTAISQAKPVEGIKGLYSMELTITPQTGPDVPADKVATYPKILDFLRRIEHDRRTAQITQINIQPGAATTSIAQAINFSLTINIFMRPTQ